MTVDTIRERVSLSELIDNAWANAERKGFHRALRYNRTLAFCAAVGLVVTELGEAIEADRNGDMDGRAEEIADTVIRLFDLAREFDIPLETEINRKMALNAKRPHLHNKLY